MAENDPSDKSVGFGSGGLPVVITSGNTVITISFKSPPRKPRKPAGGKKKGGKKKGGKKKGGKKKNS
jgi:hypothetical protein